jgi:NIMA (never in mitosis gene a)-related kinase
MFQFKSNFKDDASNFLEFFNKKVPEEPLTENEICDIFSQIVLAVQYLHDVKKIIHRDIKMKNIFINWNQKDRKFEAKLGDFGISKVLENTLKMTTTCIGTPFYMSPESCMGLEYNFKSDIWSLGCFLYEICTGKRPFEGKQFQVGFMVNTFHWHQAN